MNEKVSRQESIIVDSVTEALLRLMREKQVDEISVSELAQLAGIGRVTFYRNFQNKDEVLQRYLQKETTNFLSRSELNILATESPRGYIEKLLSHLYDYRETVDLLRCSGKMYLLEAEFDRAFHARLDGTADRYQIAFISGGFFKVFFRWAENQYRESPAQLAARIVTQSGQFEFLKKS